MASKPLILATMLGASIGVPYVATRSNGGADAAPTAPAAPAAAALTNNAAAPPLFTAPAAMPAASPVALPSTVVVAPATPQAAVPRSPTAEQALRFDVTKEWVYRSWDRKSTGPTDVGLFAVRVPLVTGTQSASLAGSLTYYFNVQNQVEHISFRGRTGDPTVLVRFLMQRYQFQPGPAAPGELVYQVTDSGGVQSELRTRPEPIVASASPHGSHSVELELARPGSERYLPPRPTNLAIPQTPDVAAQAEAANAAASKSADAAGEASSGSGYWDRIRHATPQEEGQAFWKRWPN
jgi:hypothetical protein